jgi:hypothetical protein
VKRCAVILGVLLVAVGLMAANSKTSSKLESANMYNRPEWLSNVLPLKFNRAVDDIDTIFAHIAGSYADSAYWAFIAADTISVTDSLYVTDDLEVGDDVLVNGSATVTEVLTVSDSLYVLDAEVGDSLYVVDDATVDGDVAVGGNTALTGTLDVTGTGTFDSCYVAAFEVDSMIISGPTVLDEAIDAADKYIPINIGGTDYKLLLKAY